MAEGTGKKIVKGVAYNSAARFLVIAIQGVAGIVLARLLSSTDYGIVAFAAIFVTFLSQFSDFGIGSALVERKVVDQKVLNTAFTVRNLLSLVLIVVAVVLSFIVPHFFDTPHIDWVIRLLALNFVLNSFGFVSTALLRREMNFLGGNIALFVSTAAGAVVAVVLALYGFGFWSLVYSALVSSLVSAIVINMIRPCHLRYEFHRETVREFWKFGSYMFLAGLTTYVLFNTANFIVGAVAGAEMLGYFSLALDWGSRVPVLLGMTVLSVLFPAFASIRDDKAQLRKMYVESVRYSGFLAILLNGTLLCISEDFLRTILGAGTDKWMPALDCFRILCVYGIVRAILEPLGNVIVVFGDTKVLFQANLIASVVQIALLYPALAWFGVEGVAFVVLCSYALQYAIYLPYMASRAEIGAGIFLKAVSLPVFCSVSFVAVYGMFHYLGVGDSLPLIGLKVVVYAAAYVLPFSYLTDFQIVRHLKELTSARMQ